MNLIQKSLEIFGALGVAHGEQTMPGGQTQRAEHNAPRIAATDTYFGGLPAWRVASDTHTCPLVSGTVPHVGGTVAAGSTTVLIEGVPAARAGDQLVEVGPPNAIAKGELTVLIG